MTKLSISELNIYPLKSARGISLESIQLNSQGPECDRRWMVIDNEGHFVTQRTIAKMCLINSQLTAGDLFITAKGMKQCKVPAGGHKQRKSSVWGSEVIGEDCGNQAAEWISEMLAKECRIIYMTDDYCRLVDLDFAKHKEQVGFADGFPLLLTTQASLDDFNSKLSASEPGFKVAMNRFRPNIVIAGNAAWDEDRWQKIAIGDVEFSLVKPCSRCIMPSVDPSTGVKQMQVNQALLKYRRRDTQTYFGQNAIYNQFGKISIGDTVRIIS